MIEQIREDVITINRTVKKSILQLVARGETLQRVDQQSRALVLDTELFARQIRRQRLGAPLAYLAERWDTVLSFAHSLDWSLSFLSFLCCAQL